MVAGVDWGICFVDWGRPLISWTCRIQCIWADFDSPPVYVQLMGDHRFIGVSGGGVSDLMPAGIAKVEARHGGQGVFCRTCDIEMAKVSISCSAGLVLATASLAQLARRNWGLFSLLGRRGLSSLHAPKQITCFVDHCHKQECLFCGSEWGT